MSLPLAGVRALDFTRFVAGPYCALMLGDLGAEVIKVEPSGEGDDTRRVVTYEGRRPEDQDYFTWLNRSKKSVTLDLKHPEGRAIAQRIARHSDVVLENFTPGVTARLGLGYATLSALNPDLVYCSISGFGQTGPYRHRRGLDAAMQGISGYMSLIGEPEGSPYAAGLPIADTCVGMWGAFVIVASLFERLATGRGRYIDVAMLDVMMVVMTTRMAEYLSSGKVTGRIGNENPIVAPVNNYRCADGRYINVVCSDDPLWRRLCEAIGLQDAMNDPRYATNRARIRHRAQVSALVTARLAEWPAYEWDRILSAAGVACGLVNDLVLQAVW